MLVKESAAQAAKSTLEQVWDGEFPIDPRKLAEAHGIKVEFVSLLEDISGAIVANDRDDVRILVSETEDFARQRFTIAHELGHYIERRIANDDEYSFVERRGGAYSLHELFADTYAANLLMPESKFRRIHDITNDISVIANYFAVSPSAARMRANKLGLR